MADRLGRNFVGVELNPEYAEMAAKRIHDANPLFANVTSSISTDEARASSGDLVRKLQELEELRIDREGCEVHTTLPEDPRDRQPPTKGRTRERTGRGGAHDANRRAVIPTTWRCLEYPQTIVNTRFRRNRPTRFTEPWRNP